MSKAELLKKQKEGTLTQDEQLLFLMEVRGMKRIDAERLLEGAPRTIISDTVIHLG